MQIFALHARYCIGILIAVGLKTLRRMETNSVSPISNLYTVTRGQIEHINNNLGQRIIWLVIAQSFFFNAYALLILGKPQLPQLQHLFRMFLVIVPLASLLTVVMTLIDVLGIIRRRKKLRVRYESAGFQDEMNTYPEVDGTRVQRVYDYLAPITLPVMFIVIWVIVIGSLKT